MRFLSGALSLGNKGTSRPGRCLGDRRRRPPSLAGNYGCEPANPDPQSQRLMAVEKRVKPEDMRIAIHVRQYDFALTEAATPLRATVAHDSLKETDLSRGRKPEREGRRPYAIAARLGRIEIRLALCRMRVP